MRTFIALLLAALVMGAPVTAQRAPAERPAHPAQSMRPDLRHRPAAAVLPVAHPPHPNPQRPGLSGALRV